MSLSLKVAPSTELRRLPLQERNKLVKILNRNNCWKELAEIITHPDKDELLFTADDIGTLELQWKRDSSPGEVLLNHWSTCGKKQANVKDLLQFLNHSSLFRAERDVRKEILKISDETSSGPEIGDITSALFIRKIDGSEDCGTDIIDKNLLNVNFDELTMFSYSEIEHATKKFADKAVNEGGCKIGEGSYGSVFVAQLHEKIAAVKRLKGPVNKQFFTELNVLTKFKHENLLPLIGFSVSGPTCCLVYEYMINGSLQERLACLGNSAPLSWKLRLSIAYGTAQGINHLHVSGEKPMVHRDIKSANILLDKYFVPKVGDFGLVRTGDSSASSTVAVTGNIYGTSVYMAREAFCGDVSIKLDTFSFGVVLLELLTGLPPYDTTREDRDIVTYMENCDDILCMIDPKITCDAETAVQFHKIANSCLAESKRIRPTMSEVLGSLRELLS